MAASVVQNWSIRGLEEETEAWLQEGGSFLSSIPAVLVLIFGVFCFL